MHINYFILIFPSDAFYILLHVNIINVTIAF